MWRIFAVCGLLGAGCRTSEGGGTSAPSASPSSAVVAPSSVDVAVFLRAEAARNPNLVPTDALTSDRVELRRLAARALARIQKDRMQGAGGTASGGPPKLGGGTASGGPPKLGGGTASGGPPSGAGPAEKTGPTPLTAPSLSDLRGLLADDDDEVLSWAAYGLGFECTVQAASSRVPLLAARLATRSAQQAGSTSAGLSAILRALGNCGTRDAEAVLAAWLGRAPLAKYDAAISAAAEALGTIPSRRKQMGAGATKGLSDASLEALLRLAEAAPSPAPTTGAIAPKEAALWALSRTELGSFAERAEAAAISIQNDSSNVGLFALRVHGRAASQQLREGATEGPKNTSPKPAAKDHGAHALAEIAKAETALASHRVEALKALDSIDAEYEERAGLLGELVLRVEDASKIQKEFHILELMIQELASHPEGTSRAPVASLTKLANLSVSGASASSSGAAGLARRVATLRCSAAALLATSGRGTALLGTCDAAKGAPYRRAKAMVLLRGDAKARMTPANLLEYEQLAQAASVAERESLLHDLGPHDEAAPLATKWVAAGLLAKEPGMVATAATFVKEHLPLLGNVKAPKGKEAVWIGPLREAVQKTWSEDPREALVETKISLLEALAEALPEEAAPALRKAACSANVTLAAKARSLLEGVERARGASGANAMAFVCAAPSPLSAEPVAAPHDVRLNVHLDSGMTLSLHLASSVAPLTVARIAGLARSHFYDGVIVHRVVPGFVVQFGDPHGDGYGGSGDLLPCETSPVPFRTGSVGMALSGRDTGSSQLFVTLAPVPHLDGNYTQFGEALPQASGTWDEVAEGDVITSVDVVDE